jgi:hypothetical protein
MPLPAMEDKGGSTSSSPPSCPHRSDRTHLLEDENIITFFAKTKKIHGTLIEKMSNIYVP